MAELGQEMDVDSNLVVPSQRSKSPRPWEISKLREAITATFTQILEPIRQVVREEVSSAIKCEQREVSEGVFGRGRMTRCLFIR